MIETVVARLWCVSHHGERGRRRGWSRSARPPSRFRLAGRSAWSGPAPDRAAGRSRYCADVHAGQSAV